MSATFLHTPEKYAGYPITLEEAVELIQIRMAGPDHRLEMDVEDCVSASRAIWNRLTAGLSLGRIHAFCQAEANGLWYRVPADYWKDWGKLHPSREFPPEFLHEVPSLDWVPIHLKSAPLLVWRDDVHAIAAAWAKQHEAEKVEPAVPLSARSNGPPFGRSTHPREFDAWYKARVDAAPPQGYNRDEDEAAARGAGISRDNWRDLHRRLAPEHWKRPGRPPAKPGG